MQLLAISDLHLSQASNKDAILKMSDHGDDWLIIGIDISEKQELQEFLFKDPDIMLFIQKHYIPMEFIYLLDEPSTGLDKVSENQLISSIEQIKGEMTIIIATVSCNTLPSRAAASSIFPCGAAAK